MGVISSRFGGLDRDYIQGWLLYSRATNPLIGSSVECCYHRGCRASGGIGRRAGFRFLSGQPGGGSSPLSPTLAFAGGHLRCPRGKGSVQGAARGRALLGGRRPRAAPTGDDGVSSTASLPPVAVA